ncbi:MAG: hypothetical protein ACQCN6_01645 [Candidatus Bathyarchaeia archaeon]
MAAFSQGAFGNGVFSIGTFGQGTTTPPDPMLRIHISGSRKTLSIKGDRN